MIDSLPGEEWRPIPDHPLLEASTAGRIKRLERPLVVSERLANGRSKGNFRSSIPEGIVSQHLGHNGYKYIDFVVSGKRNRRLVHRLVALAFVPGHFHEATVDHVDGDRTNNVPSNLRWVSRAENTKLQNAHGRGAPKGEKHPGAKLKDEDVRQIFLLIQQGHSYNTIGKMLGVSGSLIHKISSGKNRAWQTSGSLHS